MLLVTLCRNWLARRLSWSNSRESWIERGTALGLLSAAGFLCWHGTLLSVGQHTVLWALLLVLLAIVLRRGWIKLVGPLFFYDLVRSARRRQHLFMRCLYAGILLWMFIALWVMAFTHHRDLDELFTAEALSVSEIAKLNYDFFSSFMCFQLGAVFLLTPAYVAGAIPAEKERRTLELLLASDLRDREIVLGLLCSRLANLLLLLLTGFPILSLMQVLGGLDPYFLLAAFSATGLLVISLGCLSILNSVYARKPVHAIIRTYLIALVYLGLSGAARGLLPFAAPFVPGLASFPSTDDWASPVTLQDVVNWFGAGNLGIAAVEIESALERGGTLDVIIPPLLEDYAWFHALAALGCLGWAVLRLRAVALKQAAGPPARAPVIERDRPRVGWWPMFWKEFWVENQPARGRRARLGNAFLVLVSFLPALGILGVFIYAYPADWYELAEWMNHWVRGASTTVMCLMLLLVAIRAGGAITSERDRQTLDSLLTAPLGYRDILFAKWLASILRPLWGWPWLAGIWLVAYLCGGLELWSVPCLVAAWLLFAPMFASLGLWVSVRSRSTQRAVGGTVLAVVVLCCGHWLLFISYEAAITWLFDSPFNADWLAEFHAIGLTPPLTLDLLTVAEENRYISPDRWQESFITGLLPALPIWGIGAAVLWTLAAQRFRKDIGRAADRKQTEPKSALKA